MYTRTPNYMWMQTLVTTVPIVTHRNEWGLRLGVSTHETGKKRNTSSTKTHQIYKEAVRWTEIVTIWTSESIGPRESREWKKNRNPVKQKIHRCTKFDEMWRALTYRMIFTLLHQNDSQNPFHRKNSFILCNGKKNIYIHTPDIYISCVFFRRHCCCCACCHCRFPVISRNETEHFNCGSVAIRVQPYFHVLCGVCCAKKKNLRLLEREKVFRIHVLLFIVQAAQWKLGNGK